MLENLYVRFYGYPLFIQLALIVIIISVSTLVLTNAVILLQRIEFAYSQLQLSRAKKVVTGELTTNLMLKDDISKPELAKLAGRLKRLSRRRKPVRDLIVEELIFYRRNFSGHIAEQIAMLYNELNFVKVPIRHLRKRAWYKKTEALRQLQELPASIDHDSIFRT